jgi:nitroreductase
MKESIVRDSAPAELNSGDGKPPDGGPRIRRWIPESLRWRYRALRDLARTLRNMAYDGRRYLRYSVGSAPRRHEPRHATAMILKHGHMVEKGLALASPRPGFGVHAIQKLCALIAGEIKYGRSGTHVGYAVDALQSYAYFNDVAQVRSAPAVHAVLGEARAAGISPRGKATKRVSRAEIVEAVNFDAERFFLSRYSVRQFSGAPVPPGTIRDAVRLAQSTPSVCNRQSAHVFAITGRTVMEGILSFQNGNRGFGHQAGAVLIVTSDLQDFVGPGERYQNWIDGGMFAMTLVLALHARGLATCCLNWSNDAAVDVAFRTTAQIPPSHNVIMLIAVGTLPEAVQVARSARKPLEEVLTVIS